MLKTSPEARWSIQQVREGLGNIISRQDFHHESRITLAKDGNMGKPWAANQWLRVWAELEYNQCLQQHSRAMQPILRATLTGLDVVGSRHISDAIVSTSVHTPALPDDDKNEEIANGADASTTAIRNARGAHGDTQLESSRNSSNGSTLWRKARSLHRRGFQAIWERGCVLIRRKERHQHPVAT